VPENKKAVDKYLPAIIDDLSQNLNSHLWRNRQARYVSWMKQGCLHEQLQVQTLGYKHTCISIAPTHIRRSEPLIDWLGYTIMVC
jgi:hypothetical protein